MAILIYKNRVEGMIGRDSGGDGLTCSKIEETLYVDIHPDAVSKSCSISLAVSYREAVSSERYAPCTSILHL